MANESRFIREPASVFFGLVDATAPPMGQAPLNAPAIRAFPERVV